RRVDDLPLPAPRGVAGGGRRGLECVRARDDGVEQVEERIADRELVERLPSAEPEQPAVQEGHPGRDDAVREPERTLGTIGNRWPASRQQLDEDRPLEAYDGTAVAARGRVRHSIRLATGEEERPVRVGEHPTTPRLSNEEPRARERDLVARGGLF